MVLFASTVSPGVIASVSMPTETLHADRTDSAVRVATTPLISVLAELSVATGSVPLVADADRIAAASAAAAPNSRRALVSDLLAFDRWCRGQRLAALPATGPQVASYLKARAAAGAAPASLARYKASLAAVHGLLGLPDPTRDPLVGHTLRMLRRARGTEQRQARPLRFKGAVRNLHADAPRGLSLAAVLASCPDTVEGCRDAALLSVAYDTGLRASELVALNYADLMPAIAADAALVRVRRSKGDQEGHGATAYLSPRSVRALARWQAAAGLVEGPLFRRVFLRRVPGRAAIRGAGWAQVADGVLRHGRLPDQPAQTAHTVRTVGREALTAAALTGIYRRAARRAWDGGHLPDLSRQELEAWIKGLSAHSTRVGLTQDLFTAGEDLAGIMDALRWKTPRMALQYNRNLAAESGAAGRVVSRL